MEYTRNTDMEMELSPAKKGMEEISWSLSLHPSKFLIGGKLVSPRVNALYVTWSGSSKGNPAVGLFPGKVGSAWVDGDGYRAWGRTDRVVAGWDDTEEERRRRRLAKSWSTTACFHGTARAGTDNESPIRGGGKRGGSIAVCSLPYIPRPSCFNQAINKFSGRFSRRYKARKSLAATLND